MPSQLMCYVNLGCIRDTIREWVMEELSNFLFKNNKGADWYVRF